MARRHITLDHIPPEHHQGVGLVSNSWAHLEGVVERIIWRLARLNDNRGLVITTHMGIRSRLDTACALADLEFPDAAETKRLFKLRPVVMGNTHYGNRNEIVHSRTLYFADWPGSQTIRPTYKARGKLFKAAKPVDLKEYETTSKTILATASELRELLAGFVKLVAQKDGAPSP